ncbi:MAG: tripartite tricarboxylate transporter substrate-binding protein [Pigmentiphaga sp.]|nr:tripartite tricarboxylate transporter substrate-binding protein [Pigmentiphaga sp.]
MQYRTATPSALSFPALKRARFVAHPIKAGKIKALGVTQRERYPGLPDVPAINEFLPGFEMTSWLGFFAPAGLPPPLLDTISQSMRAALQEPKTVAQLAELGLMVEANEPQAFATQQKEAFASRGELIRANGIRAD